MTRERRPGKEAASSPAGNQNTTIIPHVAHCSPYSDAAKTYADNGWTPLPLPYGHKFAPPNGTTGKDGKYPDLEQIQTWAAATTPHNVGLRLPQAVVGIDVDVYEEKRGDETLALILTAYGEELPPTVVSSSRFDTAPESGIRLFLLPPGIDNRQLRDVGLHIETIRWDYRYAVVAPSVVDGRTYRWLDQRSGEYIDTLPPWETLPTLPEGFAAYLNLTEQQQVALVPGVWGSKAKEEQPTQQPPPTVPTNSAAPTWAAATLEGVKANLRAAPVGLRNNTLNKECFGLGGYVAHGLFTVEQIMAELYPVALEIGETPHTARATITSGLTKGVSVPRDISHIRELQNNSKETSSSEPPLEGEALNQHLRGKLLDLAKEWDATPEDEDWILPGFLVRAGQNLIYSAPKVGKSLLLLDIAAQLHIRGRSVLTDETVPQVRVLYCDYENRKADIINRLKDLGFTKEEAAQLNYYWLPKDSKLDTPTGGRQLLAMMEATNSELAIIDTASRTITGDENSNDTWIGWYDNTGALLKQYGKSFIRLDHSGKAKGNGPRGGSAKSGDVDSIWQLTRTTDGLKLHKDDARQAGYDDNIVLLRGERHGQFGHWATSKNKELEKDILRVLFLLQEFDAEKDIGYKKAMEFLDGHGHKFVRGTCEKAIKRRKDRPNTVWADPDQAPTETRTKLEPGWLGSALKESAAAQAGQGVDRPEELRGRLGPPTEGLNPRTAQVPVSRDTGKGREAEQEEMGNELPLPPTGLPTMCNACLATSGQLQVSANDRCLENDQHTQCKRKGNK